LVYFSRFCLFGSRKIWQPLSLSLCLFPTFCHR
jgi:hypothetical protein